MEFDAGRSGGYRDMLLNLQDVASGHIVEVQVTLKPLLEIKNRGGHTLYELARLLDLNAKTTHTFFGKPTAETLQKVSAGMVRSVEMISEDCTAGLGLQLLSSPAGILSPQSAITYLRLDKIAGFSGKPLSSLWTPALLKHLAPTITYIDVCGTGVTGDIPDELWTHCLHLKTVYVCWEENLQAKLSPLVGNLKELTTLGLWCSKVTGPVPKELGNCSSLRSFSVCECGLSGELPVELKKLKKLETLSLSENPDLKVNGNTQDWESLATNNNLADTQALLSNLFG